MALLGGDLSWRGSWRARACGGLGSATNSTPHSFRSPLLRRLGTLSCGPSLGRRSRACIRHPFLYSRSLPLSPSSILTIWSCTVMMSISRWKMVRKGHSKASIGIGSRFSEQEVDAVSQRLKLEELPETWTMSMARAPPVKVEGWVFFHEA
ncbi:uncharacterized protein LOC121768185 isoform X1 [Salvia splendens]|uniref:uncharacterized protein LOC121768185 isoform X1 n=1 Tax=Salvia splendens TaxID=180675 RepID=UPI001C2636F8|nr:uncharacterized protein LOC121768185 isoform X1 [Salvia splendens]